MNKTVQNINQAHAEASPKQEKADLTFFPFLLPPVQQALNSDLLPSPSKVNSSHRPVMTKEWANGIYSFNNNYIKNIASADNTVNKMIKSFFTINPLSHNPNGKKTKLLKRRYKRLSLNRILVSKPEIKHDNNEVLITVYLFNKKKISLLKTLHMQGEKMNDLDTKTKAAKGKALPSPNFSKGLRKGKFYHNKKNRTTRVKRNLRNTRKPVFYSRLLSTRFKSRSIIFNNLAFTTKTNSRKKLLKFFSNRFYYSRLRLRRFNYNSSVISKFIKNKYTFKNRYLLPLVQSNKNKMNSKRHHYRKFPLVTKLKRKYISYRNLNNLTKNKIYKFITSVKYTLASKNHSNIEKLLKSYYDFSSKYKLLNKGMPLFDNFTFNNSQVNNMRKLAQRQSKSRTNIALSVKTLTRKVYKLKSIYKLFLLSDNLNYIDKFYNNAPVYYTTLLLNSYKLLNKTNPLRLKVSTKKPMTSFMKKQDNKLEKKPLSNVKYRLLKKLLLTHKNSSYIKLKSIARNNRNKASYQRITKMAQSVKNIVLINKIKRIDSFADRYNNVMLNNKNFSHAGPSSRQEIARNYIQNLALSFKFRYLKDILHKEIMYLYYIKLLSYNNTLFKSWFLTPLRDILSKIYNKKVVLNLINLKYIHLNSDILLQAIALRLRNIKKNKLNKVLIKALALVKLSKVNAYARDINSPVYNYVEQHFNKFKQLNTVIFNDVYKASKEINVTDKANVNNNITTPNITSTRKENTTHAYLPISTKWLNDAQTNTINLIKYKTVFGIKLEASGRLTKRSTASRAIFKFRYKGGLKNNPVISRDTSSTIIKSNLISNLQYTKVSSKTRNGSFGLKSWINNN